MPVDYGSTGTSTTTLGTNQFPISAVFVPGSTSLTALQGGPITLDANNRPYAPVVVVFGGTFTMGVPGNNGLTVVRASAGRLASVIVTTTGATQLNIYDNASLAAGTIIGAVPANAAVGSVYAFNSPAANGIVANSLAGCCSVTICYY